MCQQTTPQLPRNSLCHRLYLLSGSFRFPLFISTLLDSTNQPDHLDRLQSGTHWTTVKLPHLPLPALHFLK